jgi:parallel beta-helix repeat protein
MHIKSIKRMTPQGFPDRSSHFSSIRSAKGLAGVVPVRASLLSALLLCSGGAIALPAAALTPPSTQVAQLPASAKLVYVNQSTGSDTASAGTSETTPYRTITYALQQATSGTVVQLAPGSYTADTGEVFPLLVKQGVILRGDEQSKGQTVAIIGGGGYVSPTFSGQNIAIRAEKDSEVRGVTITNPNRRGTGLWIESTNATVSNNTFSSNDREGVFVTGTATPKIESNIFTRNKGNGISVAKTAQGEVRNNLFQETGNGIVLTETASPLLADNRIVQNIDGVVASNSAAPILRNNIIEANSRYGVVASGNAQPNLGTQDNPGQNRIRNNVRFDVANLTRTNTIIAVGNDIDSQKISGRVDFVAASIPSGGFADVQGNWAQAYIEALVAKDVIAGFPDGTFRPNEPVTRAQFAAIINKAFSPAQIQPGINFVDVRNNYWAYQAIQSAYRGGFLSGYPGQVFKAEQRIPRVQVLVSLASGLKLRSEDTNVLSVYNDATQIPSWASTAIAGATQKQLVVNYPTLAQLNPSRDATRAEVAAFVYQALVNAGRAEAISSPYLVQAP